MGISLWLASVVGPSWAGLQPIGLLTSVAAGLLFGLVGTLLDSLLGALLQSSSLTSGGQIVSRPAGEDGRHVSGVDLLSNEAVNFWSVNATALLAALVWPL